MYLKDVLNYLRERLDTFPKIPLCQLPTPCHRLNFLSDTYLGAGANLNLGLNIFNWLIGDDDFVSVEVKPSADTKLELNDSQLIIIGFGFFLVLPLLLLITGFRIWYLRNNR